MALIIGLDTGGTFTDAALLDTEKKQVLATAKSLTTRHDLAVGVGDALSQILQQWDGAVSDLSLVSLSTTLATNAVVEGIGGVVGLVLIGFDDDVLERANLKTALGADPVLAITGGHKTDGRPQAPFDAAGLKQKIEDIAPHVASFAVAGHFATRNPEHEHLARDIITEQTGKPVTCSSELSSGLGGPKRALTALLNARLISLLERLISATDDRMKSLGVECPLMVVKGDGSLLNASVARMRPIETVLSGPAASLAGAAFLAAEPDGLVADIGGTTTDIALLENGMPRLSDTGAYVGGWQTMVEAARIRTCGLGGDSEVSWHDHEGRPALKLGPRRAVPLSLIGAEYPEITEVLEHQLAQPIALPSDGVFILPVMPDGVPEWLTRSEQKLAEQALQKPWSALADLATTQVALGAVSRLMSKGLLLRASFTPTDAVHIAGVFARFNTRAAQLGGQLLARQKTPLGKHLASDEHEIAAACLDALVRQSAIAIMDAAFAEDGKGENIASSSALLSEQLSGNKTQTATSFLSLGLQTKLIALGASSSTHYPRIAERIQAELVNPPHADVAGAVGAAAGAVRQRHLILVTQPSEGCFRVHLPHKMLDFTEKEEAFIHAREQAETLARERAEKAGATDITVSLEELIDDIDLGNDKRLFLQARIIGQATGLPAA